MESGTFSDPSLINYINDNYIPVKLDGEAKEAYKLRDYEFKYISNAGRGYNELAAALLDGKMGYPSTVFMTENMERITVYPGYQEASAYKSVLKFIAEDIYLTKSFADYSAGK
jgi:thioredoxin-related protein